MIYEHVGTWVPKVARSEGARGARRYLYSHVRPRIMIDALLDRFVRIIVTVCGICRRSALLLNLPGTLKIVP